MDTSICYRGDYGENKKISVRFVNSVVSPGRRHLLRPTQISVKELDRILDELFIRRSIKGVRHILIIMTLYLFTQ